MKRILTQVLTLLLLVTSAMPLLASHEMGVQITYSCQSACTTRVEVKAYRNCTGANLIGNTITWGGPPGCIAPNPITAWSTEVRAEVTPICPSSATSCTVPGSALDGVEELSWHRDYDICAGSPCTYTLFWSDCCRNPSITSLFNPGSQGMATSGTTINTALGTCNNSPIYTNLPLFYACQGLDYDVHQGALDLDGDSLVFSMGPCYQSQNTLVAYNAGYSQTAPLGPSWNVTLNPQTGILHLDANPGNAEIGVMCIDVAEYRNGAVIGHTQRDIQIVILPCGNNQNPTFDPISNATGGAIVVGDDIYLNNPGPFCFQLGTADVDPLQNLRLWWEDNPTSATFTDVNSATTDTVIGTNQVPPAGRFCWTPPAVGTYLFKFRVQDSFCPIFGFAEKVVIIHVGPCAGATASATVSACPAANFTASTCMLPPVSYTWSGAGGFSSTLQNPTYTYAVPGSYAWQVIVTNGTQTDTVTGVVNTAQPTYQSFLSGIHVVYPCSGSLYDTLDAGTWSSYLWSTGATTQELPVFLGGIYGVTVSAPNGCTYHDSTELYWQEPNIYGVVTTSTGAPLQNQKILLVQHDTTAQALWAVDSAYTDSMGYYFFCNVVDTMVFLKAVPNAFDYPTQMPTYADTTLYWNGAIPFLGVLQMPFQHDFSTLYGSNPGGLGFIGGLISQGANKMSAIGDPIPNLRVYLRDAITGDILGHRVTNAAGYFSFANIPLGDYNIVPDRPLVSTTNVPLLRIDAQTPVRDSLEFQLHHYWLELMAPTVGVSSPLAGFSFAAMPNPFGSTTTLALDLPVDAAVTIEVFDIVGKRLQGVYAGELQAGKYRYEIGNALTAGIYFVRLRMNDADHVVKIMKRD